MSAPEPTAPDVVDPAPRYGVRPVGTWVVAGFLTVTVVAIWIFVALVFASRS